MNEELLWQFDLTWALADLHLAAVVEDDFLWEPAPLCWTVRPDAAGVWRPDWAESEPAGPDDSVAHLAHQLVVVAGHRQCDGPEPAWSGGRDVAG